MKQAATFRAEAAHSVAWCVGLHCRRRYPRGRRDRTLVAALLGQRRPAALDWIDLPLAAPLPATGDRETFVRAMLVDGKFVPLANQDSGGQRALAEASWLVRCPAGQPALAAGARVSALLF